MLPSATLGRDGQPRFLVPLLGDLVNNDPAIKALVRYELEYDGWERITRDVLDAHLQTGDLFIDAGAHWGVMTLSAGTAPAGQIRVMAIEPHPLNVYMLMRAVTGTPAGKHVEIVAAGAGDAPGTVALKQNTSMGHSLQPQTHDIGGETTLSVPVVTIDALMAERPQLAQKRIILKVDVEGLEAEVLAGAKQTIESGRVALIIWERGHHYREIQNVRARTIETSNWLKSLGYRHYTFPYHEWGGPLIPATDDAFYANIFSFAPGTEKRALYPQNFAARPMYNMLLQMVRTPEATAEVAAMCIAERTSDGTVWANPLRTDIMESARADAAARLIAPGSRVLDIGAGSMLLAGRLPPGCQYQPTDLIARSETCFVVDLNQGQFPAGQFDVVTLLAVAEYVHDVPALLRACRGAAPRLVLTYHSHESGAVTGRRQRGFFSDLSKEDLAKAVADVGFRVEARSQVGEALLWTCVAETA